MSYLSLSFHLLTLIIHQCFIYTPPPMVLHAPCVQHPNLSSLFLNFGAKFNKAWRIQLPLCSANCDDLWPRSTRLEGYRWSEKGATSERGGIENEAGRGVKFKRNRGWKSWIGGAWGVSGPLEYFGTHAKCTPAQDDQSVVYLKGKSQWCCYNGSAAGLGKTSCIRLLCIYAHT